MPVTLAVSGTDDDRAEADSLADWLDREEGLDDAEVSFVGQPIMPGQMGALSDALVITLGSGSAGAILARSISVWLGTRASDVKLKISNGKRSVELDARRIRDPQAMVRQVEQLIDDDHDADGAA